MTCTYYGGSTAKFVTDVLRCGVTSLSYRPENFAIHGIQAPNGRNDIKLFAVGLNVAYDFARKSLPRVLNIELDTALQVKDSWSARTTKAINIEFLAACKLLDMQTYTDALKNNPSPIALGLAIQRAKESLKPDFPRTRKGGVNVLDFIEELVYFDLTPFETNSFLVAFTTGTYDVKSSFEHDETGLDIYIDMTNGDGVEFARDAYKDRNPSGCLNLKYFEELGLIDITLFNVYTGVVSPPEALQRAVREAVGYHVPDASTVELPSNLLGDD